MGVSLEAAERIEAHMRASALLATSLGDTSTSLFERRRDWVRLSVDYRTVLDFSTPQFRDLVIALRDEAYGEHDDYLDAWSHFRQLIMRHGIIAPGGEEVTLCRDHFIDACAWAREFEGAQSVRLELQALYELDDDEVVWEQLSAVYDRVRRTRFAAISAGFACYEAGFMEIAGRAIQDEAVLRDLDRGERWPRLFRLAHCAMPDSSELQTATRQFDSIRRIRHDLVHGSLALRTVRNANLISEQTEPATIWAFLEATRFILREYARALGTEVDLPAIREPD